MLHVQAVHSCHEAGLDPLLGFYHRPSFGRESLASDLIEPLRPAVDTWIWRLFRDRVLRDDHFTVDRGACLIGKSGRRVFYGAWQAESESHQRWLRRNARKLGASLRTEGLAWITPIVDGSPLESSEQET